MEQKNKIQELIERFHQGQASREEKLQLQRYLSQEDPELNQYAEAVWAEYADASSVMPVNKVLDKIHQELGMTNSDNISHPGNWVRFLGTFSRYAAIFIIGFGIAWWFRPVPSLPLANISNTGINKVKVAYGSKSTIELPDGTVATLNSGSTLTYSGSFEAGNRMVSLEGEAYFDVKKDPSHPFLVKTRDITVKVLGTKFNVKSYADDKVTETTLVTGKVEILPNVRLANGNKSHSLFLAPNQKAVFTRKDGELAVGNSKLQEMNAKSGIPEALQVTIHEKVKTELETSWKNNVLTLNSEPFGDIVKKLERWYNVEVKVQYVKLNPVIFSGKFDKESVEDVLHALSLIEPFHYEISKNHITIYK